MNLRELRIERARYGKNEGQLVGSIKFDNELGEVSLKLTKEHCDKIFRVCADGVLATAKSAADEMTCSVIEHKAKLETDSVE